MARAMAMVMVMVTAGMLGCASSVTPPRPSLANASAKGAEGNGAQGNGTQSNATQSNAADAPRRACDPARDRAAIRAMAGEYRVSFAFDETEPRTKGYVPHAPYRASASEVVQVLEETDRKVVLQHVLVHAGTKSANDAPSVMKHWRQDWTFEDRELLEFRGNGVWERRALSAEQAACTWSQAVFEVDDGPRYESFGRWTHERQGETSTWTSEETWRPLPRREYTKRSDYDVLIGTNRHVVTPNGWRHEQDTRKLVLEGRRELVGERGLNRYERTPLDGAEAARVYLRDTAAFWQTVRDEWQAVFTKNPRVHVQAETDGGERLYDRLFPMARTARDLRTEDRKQKVREAIASFVVR
ncbi:DUF6607 family protein [Pendulispora albinea]|uniref:Lipoprotein n=1 Tax=Pendulispora albinea TaxID=2741071 RepID=A0ABZ2MC10_9BACT